LFHSCIISTPNSVSEPLLELDINEINTQDPEIITLKTREELAQEYENTSQEPALEEQEPTLEEQEPTLEETQISEQELILETPTLEEITFKKLNEAFELASLFTHAFHADRREQGRALDEGAAEHDEGSAKASSFDVTTNSQCARPVATETKASVTMVRTSSHLLRPR